MQFTDEQFKKDSEQLIDFIYKSPSPYHVVNNIAAVLNENGFIRLSEGKAWKINPSGRYYVIRGGSSIIAFNMPKAESYKGYNIAASHSDSPSFKIKENPEITTDKHYISLNVEKYGGMIMSTWLDRPLSVAGYAVAIGRSGIKEYLVNADKDLLVIPNLAIHMNRSVNDNTSLNPQKDMLPLFGDINAKDNFDEYIKSCIQSEDKDKESVADESLTTELFLYNREKGRIWGCNDEYISAPRLDDIQCAYSSLMAYIKALGEISDDYDKVNVCCVFNNEEVGSTTMQGADSTFLSDVLERISIAYGLDREKYMMAIASSYMVSADNAHAVHPNHTDKADLTNRPYMNEGIVIKFNGNQKYTTDSVSYAIFKDICDKRNVPYQTYANRSDIAGGSTLGNISISHVSVNTVDIGLAQLAMHSAYETAGVKDTTYMIEALTGVFLR